VLRERVGDNITQRSSGSFTREKVELHQIIVQVGETRYPVQASGFLAGLWQSFRGGDTRLVSATDNVEPTANAIETGLKRFHKKNDYSISVPLALLRQARETQRIFNIVLGSIAGISLLVGGIGIMNIMLASVTERTREIGVRRAIGAKRRQIIGQFLIETVVLSTIGGLIGVLLGVVIPAAIEYFANMPTIVTGTSILLSLGISAAVGIIFGLYPAYRAAMLDPIEALRHE
jgi:putative ABC transport system permease protein